MVENNNCKEKTEGRGRKGREREKKGRRRKGWRERERGEHVAR